MRLYLCRHASAVDGDAQTVDESRWLTAFGRDEARRVGGVLRAGDAPAHILTSPLVRAVQTAELLAQATGYRGEIKVLPALAPEGRLSSVLSGVAERVDTSESVYLVGHEPQMSGWGTILMGRPFGRGFAKGGVLRLDWEAAPSIGTGQGVFYLTPAHATRERV